MSSLSDCCAPCSTQVPPISIPGPSVKGDPGDDGIDGISAYTTTTADFTSQGDLTTAFNISVATSLPFAVGMDVFAGQGPGAILANPGPWAGIITAIPTPNSITVKNLRTVDQSVTVSSGAVFAAIGLMPATPLLISQGGTSSTTKSAAQLALGLGQSAVVSSGAALAQVATNAFVQVGAIDCQLTSAGVWELRGFISIDFLGVTFAASRTISAKIRNITQGTDLATGVLHTQALTTLNLPTHYLQIPPVVYSGVVANDHLQILAQIDTVNSAGTLTFDAGSLEAIPLRLT